MSWRQPELSPLARVSELNNVVAHMIFGVSENIFDENETPDSRIFTTGDTSQDLAASCEN
jgi:hypothetical protein